MRKFANLAAAGAAVALTLVFAVGVVSGSNMGFKLEKSFEVLPGNGNFYWTSFPFFASFPDANEPCGIPGCSNTPNGIVDSEDALRDMWEGNGTMSIFRVDNSASVNRTFFTLIQVNPFTQLPEIIGDEVFSLEADGNDSDRSAEGYYIQVAGPPACVNAGDPDCPVNQAVIVGSHDVNFDPGGATPGLDMPFVPGNRNFYAVNVPYHTTYVDAYNLLCGPDSAFPGGRDGNNQPTDGTDVVCPGGAFNGEDTLNVFTYDNTKAPFGGTYFLVVQINPFTQKVEFLGDLNDVWPVNPGEGYSFQVTGNGTGGSNISNFNSPHF